MPLAIYAIDEERHRCLFIASNLTAAQKKLSRTRPTIYSWLGKIRGGYRIVKAARPPRGYSCTEAQDCDLSAITCNHSAPSSSKVSGHCKPSRSPRCQKRRADSEIVMLPSRVKTQRTKKLTKRVPMPTPIINNDIKTQHSEQHNEVMGYQYLPAPTHYPAYVYASPYYSPIAHPGYYQYNHSQQEMYPTGMHVVHGTEPAYIPVVETHQDNMAAANLVSMSQKRNGEFVPTYTHNVIASIPSEMRMNEKIATTM
eukprot:m.67389 g.67389  ORF g.67389 m.67389 type:complete len:255 (-) comp11885_c0_seq2:2359-3123(-)